MRLIPLLFSDTHRSSLWDFEIGLIIDSSRIDGNLPLFKHVLNSSLKISNNLGEFKILFGIFSTPVAFSNFAFWSPFEELKILIFELFAILRHENLTRCCGAPQMPLASRKYVQTQQQDADYFGVTVPRAVRPEHETFRDVTWKVHKSGHWHCI